MPRAERRRGPGLIFWISVAWIAMIAFAAVFADVLPIRDPDELGIRTQEVSSYETPGWNAYFGGDQQGRDMFARVVFGARPALVLAVSVTAIAFVVGGTLGVIAGYVRGRVDAVIMAVVDAALAFPALVLLFAVSATWGIRLAILIPVFAVLGVPPYTRIVRGVTLTLAEREFIDAARAMGASRARIVLRELVPNVALPALAFAFLGFAIVIATEGALAFVGLGLDETTWGSLIADGQGKIRQASHLALIPATVMFLTILAANYIGDGLRSLIDTRPTTLGARVSRPAPLDADADPPAGDALLSIRNLRTSFATPAGVVTAVDGVSLDLQPGRTLGVVGESGCGKTMLLRSILGTFPIPHVQRSGAVVFDGVDLLRASDEDRRRILGTEIGVVSQNPLTALNPVRTIGSQLIETMRVHRDISKAAARARALDLLQQVGIGEPERRLGQHPHQLSGGMRQRVTIAVALANEPRLLLADEPTTALDVTIQDQLLTLLRTLADERDMALVLVTHDLSVVKGWTDDVAVMYAAQLVETGPTGEVFAHPQHRYTEALLQSIPRLDLPSHRELSVIDGQPPQLVAVGEGCRFAERCPSALDRCAHETPPVTTAGATAFRCWNPAGAVVAGLGADHGR